MPKSCCVFAVGYLNTLVQNCQVEQKGYVPNINSIHPIYSDTTFTCVECNLKTKELARHLRDTVAEMFKATLACKKIILRFEAELFGLDTYVFATVGCKSKDSDRQA